MTEAQKQKMTVDEFFAWQAMQDEKYELVDGVPILFRGPPVGRPGDYDVVVANLARLLRMAPNTNWFLVDIGSPNTASLPVLAAEIMSPFSASYDTVTRLCRWWNDDTCRVILLAGTEAAHVSLWRRGENGWQPEFDDGLDAVVPLPEIDAALPLAELYKGIEFAA